MMKDMYLYNVYLEPADTDDPKKLIGTIEAVGDGRALELASQYYEYPSYDLVIIRKDLDTTKPIEA